MVAFGEKNRKEHEGGMVQEDADIYYDVFVFNEKLTCIAYTTEKGMWSEKKITVHWRLNFLSHWLKHGE